MLGLLVQIVVGFLYANLFEWIWHKYVFHGLGKKKKSRFSSHWKNHHRAVRKNSYRDDSYRHFTGLTDDCLLYTSPSPRDKRQSRMPSSA